MAVITPGLIDDGTISNAKLQNDSVTINGQTVALGGSTTLDTDAISEGLTNQYFTDARAISAVEGEPTLTLGNISHSGNWTLSSSNGEITITPQTNGYVWAEGDFYTGTATGFYMDGTTLSSWPVGSAPAITIDREVSIADDVSVGVSSVRDTAALATKGIHIKIDETITDKWAGIILEEYGDKQFSINNPIISGQVSAGTLAAPAAVPASKRILNLSASARYGSGAGEFDTIAQVKLTTNEQQSSTNRGGAITLEVNPNGGTTNTIDALKVDADVSGTSKVVLGLDPSGTQSKSIITSGSTNGIEIDTQVIVLSNLPTTDPGNPGQLWNDSGTLKVS